MNIPEIKFKAKSKANKGHWKYGFLTFKNDAFYIEDTIDVPPSWGNPCGDTVFVSDEIIPETICQYTFLKDIKGNDIYFGDKCKGVFSLRTGERPLRKGSYPVYQDLPCEGYITFDEKTGLYFFETEFKVEYMTSFWKGTGDTRSERAANAFVKTEDSPRDYLYKRFHSLEVTGNIFND